MFNKNNIVGFNSPIQLIYGTLSWDLHFWNKVETFSNDMEFHILL